ncbi:PhzF family phenazine biosynthesis protein [Sphingomonas jaspsi]|uniref:PhzF family phenazine biosynthesis protein n=1 Tax=Sphingomonas jaspsi TaxID=392409 RepID=UPI0004B362A8|nr:PhzF family phenazine biosynthesis protein [Sphingomonas jaspsi]
MIDVDAVAAGYSYVTLDVFTDTPFRGNPLAVFPDASGLDDSMMQLLAREMNYSETCFILPPDDPANDAQLRIFNRTAELPFAGHPTIGAATVLADRFGADRSALTIEVASGVVRAAIGNGDGRTVGSASIVAPQPLMLGQIFSASQLAACLGLDTPDVLTSAHLPRVASTGVEFIFAELSADALSRATPDRTAIEALRRTVVSPTGRASIYCYSRTGTVVRSRMFAPLEGTDEDPGTGSASATLAAMLLDLDMGATLSLEIRQGEQMGRPCDISVDAWRDGSDICARLSGRCVKIFEGRFTAKGD